MGINLLELQDIKSDETSEIFLRILDDINVAISVVDENLITKFWNKSAEAIYQIKREEILNKKITDFFPNALLPKVIREGKPFKNVYNSPRENCYNIISATPLFYGDKIIGGIGYDKDISEFINVTQMLKVTQSNLKVLENEVNKLNENKYSFSEIVGNNKGFIEIIDFTKNIAKSNINILLTGESGTGKEVFARGIHVESSRKGYFVPINCSSIPSELLESELFGYKGGAFTGALNEGKIGKFELADGGTLFLDEIGDMSLKMQPKILRVLEDGIVTRVGSDKEIKVNVRVIAATNKDIFKMVKEGTFRKDLYYRLNSILINLPPLRERKDDIPPLVNKFIEDFCIEYRTNIKEVDDNIIEILKEHPWEGNIRELKNIVERAVILAKNNNMDRLMIDYLPQSMLNGKQHIIKAEKVSPLDLTEISARAEKGAIIKAMEMSGGNKTRAAKLLNIPRSTLYFKLQKHNLENMSDN